MIDVIYGFGGTPGAEFGSSWKTGESIKYQYGLWGSDLDKSSSDFRELKNLVDMMLHMEKEGESKGEEIFLFTDNSTAEKAFSKDLLPRRGCMV